jgi:hypothetical protein
VAEIFLLFLFLFWLFLFWLFLFFLFFLTHQGAAAAAVMPWACSITSSGFAARSSPPP